MFTLHAMTPPPPTRDKRSFGLRVVLSSCGVLAVAYAAMVATAGPIDPPGGPITSTNKTLSEIEPRIVINQTNTPGDNDATPSMFKITQPGSYYLPGNMNGASGKIGIEIAASDVTIDLNGFRLLGATGTLAAISVTGTQSDIAIRNGVIRGWAGGGIAASTCTGCIVEDVRAIANTGNGIFVGPDAMVRRCYCVSNTQSGINASTPSEVSDCLARANGSSGVRTGDHASIAGCVTNSNTTAGLTIGAGSSVRGCITAQNGVGVSAGSGLNAVDTTARDNSSHGFTCFGASFTNCLSTANTGDGFNSDSALFTGCRSTSNNGNGFFMGSNSLLVHSIAVSNDLFGARANSGYVLRNLMGQNSLNQTELREIRFDTRGRADGNHLNSFNSSEWGIGGPQGALFIMNSMNGGFVTTFGGTEGPDIDANNINSTCNPSGNYDLP